MRLLTVLLVLLGLSAGACRRDASPAPGTELELAVEWQAGEGPRTREGARLVGSAVIAARAAREVDAGPAELESRLRAALSQALQARLDAGERAEGLAAALPELCRPLLAAQGLELVEVRRARLGLPGDERRAAVAPTTDTRLLLIGLDGFDWDVAQPLMDAGRMPHLSELVRRGTKARLQTIQPILSPVIWTTIATGKMPLKHGILDFLGTDASGNAVPVTSNLRKVKAFWNVLSDAGLSVGVQAWWATWPAEAVNGFMVSDRVAYQLFDVDDEELPTAGKVHPAALWEQVGPLVAKPKDVAPAELESFFARGPRIGGAMEAQLLEQFASIVASARSYARIGLMLHERFQPRVAAYYFEAPDTASHLFMPYAPPPLPEVDPRLQARFAPVVDRTYEYHDRILGQFLERIDDRTVVIVLSDHGFRSGAARPATESRVEAPTAADWHERFGLLVMAGPGVRSGHEVAEAGVEDIFPTMLALLGMPVAEDFDGQVLADALTPEHLAAHPVRSIPTYEDPGGPTDPRERIAVASPEDRAILESLVAIGYVSPLASPSGPIGTESAPAGPAADPGAAQANAHNNLGTVQLRQGALEAAASEFRKAVELAPGFFPARINLAQALVRLGRTAEAEAELRRVLQDNPASAKALAFLAGIQLQQGRASDAEALVRRALEAEPRSAVAWATLGEVHERQGRADDAHAAYERASQLDPDNPEPLNALGNAHEALGEHAEAARWYEKAIETDPTYAPAYNNLGLQYQRLGRWDDALALYEKGRQRLPGSSVLLNNLATWYHERALAASQSGDAAKAKELGQAAAGLYREAMAADPLDASPVNNYGAVQRLLGDPDAEIAHYRKAVEMNPRYVDALYNTGFWHVQRKEWAEAERALGAALAENPDYVRAVQLRALALLNLGRADEALALAAAALGRQPRHPVLLATAGGVLDELGRTDEACARYRASLAADPRQPQVAARATALCGPERR